MTIDRIVWGLLVTVSIIVGIIFIGSEEYFWYGLAFLILLTPWSLYGFIKNRHWKKMFSWDLKDKD
jgi:hypothetical protein